MNSNWMINKADSKPHFSYRSSVFHDMHFLNRLIQIHRPRGISQSRNNKTEKPIRLSGAKFSQQKNPIFKFVLPSNILPPFSQQQNGGSDQTENQCREGNKKKRKREKPYVKGDWGTGREEEDPESKEDIWRTARSCETTGLYLRPLCPPNSSSAFSMSPLSIVGSLVFLQIHRSTSLYIWIDTETSRKDLRAATTENAIYVREKRRKSPEHIKLKYKRESERKWNRKY